jgi:hypothetical protein
VGFKAPLQATGAFETIRKQTEITGDLKGRSPFQKFSSLSPFKGERVRVRGS